MKHTARTIGIAFNLKKPSSDDTYEEYDEIETIDSLEQELRRLAFAVVRFEQDDRFFKKISAARVDFVINIAEGRGSTRGRESQVPCVLESLGIPYSGSDPIALGITLDKYLTSLVLKACGLPVPRMHVVSRIQEAGALKGIFAGGRSFIIKPRWEGSSKGIFLNSVADNFSDMHRRVRRVLSAYRQPAVIEEFLEGDEITAGVYGNSTPRLLGMMRIRHRETAQKHFVYSLENKKEWEEKIIYEPAAVIPAGVRRRVADCAVRAFRALELRDMARIDFRLSRSGRPAIIDVNPLPGLSPRYSDLPILYRLNGGTYPRLIKILMTTALRRCGLGMHKPL